MDEAFVWGCLLFLQEVKEMGQRSDGTRSAFSAQHSVETDVARKSVYLMVQQGIRVRATMTWNVEQTVVAHCRTG